MLGDHIGRLSIWRDDCQPPQPSASESFPAYIDRINDEWVTTARRISLRLLIELSASVGDQIVEFWQSADLNTAGWPVTWAGLDPAPAWLDAAWDFTEYWALRHQVHRDPEARLELDADTTWRLCTRGITPEQATKRAFIAGDQSLAKTALNIVSIIR